MTWNVRGLGGIEKHRAVKECIRKYKPNLVVLQEMKKEKIIPLLIRSTLGCNLFSWTEIPACGSAGGILVAWDPSVVKKTDELVGGFSISLKLVGLSSGFEWLFTGVYGPSFPHNRHLFWEELYFVRGYWIGSWILGGDFNVIRFIHEKSNPSRVTRSMRDFGAFVNDCFLHECPLLTAKFT